MKARDKREETRGKRAEKRTETAAKRETKRGKVRGAAVVACLLAAALCGCNVGCNSMVPSMGSNRASYDGCTATVTVNIAASTNLPPGMVVMMPLELTIHDLLGTQSCSTEGSVADQKAGQTLTPGITGDKPVEEVGKVAAAGLTGVGSGVGAAVDEAVKALLKKTPAAPTNAVGVVEAIVVPVTSADCAGGSCGVAPLAQ